MNERIYLIQTIILRKKAKIYLEIGVQDGICFFDIKAPIKIGVDPKFSFSKKKKILLFLNFKNKFYKLTSDNFFEKKSKFLTKKGLDVVFIDGLHTHEQSLIDVQNTLKFLNKDGVIILHDCNPPSEEYAKVYPSEYSGSWCGDVWKTICYLKSTRNDLNVFVIDADSGLGIISRGVPENMLNYSLEDLKALSYKDLEKNREKILNLKSPLFFKEFISKIV